MYNIIFNNDLRQHNSGSASEIELPIRERAYSSPPKGRLRRTAFLADSPRSGLRRLFQATYRSDPGSYDANALGGRVSLSRILSAHPQATLSPSSLTSHWL
ncbi:hypothetical protein J6590_077557 [Homalodisca vitripennis]|nr:hypothetical protein J6590_077557 [Homalodisca vitripennis]